MIQKVVDDEKTTIQKHNITFDTINEKIVLAKVNQLYTNNAIYKLEARSNNNGDWEYFWFGFKDTTTRWYDSPKNLEQILDIPGIEIRIMDTIDEMIGLLKEWK